MLEVNKNVFNPDGIKKAIDYLKETYSFFQERDWDVCVDDRISLYSNEILIINFYLYPPLGYEDSISGSIHEGAIVLKRNGEIIDHTFSKISIINDSLLAYEKVKYVLIENKEYAQFKKIYRLIVEQGIIDYNGECLFCGNLGIIDKIQDKDDYLILQKNKFSEIEKDKIDYYLGHILEDSDEYEDQIECPYCGGISVWSTDEDCFICSDCGEKCFYERELKSQPVYHLTPLQKLYCDNYKCILNSHEVSDGKFVQTSLDDDTEYEEDDDFKPGPYDFIFDSEEEDHLNDILTGVYSKLERQIIVPYQPCKITFQPDGIYLANEQDLKLLKYGHLLRKKDVAHTLVYHPLSNLSLKTFPVSDAQNFEEIFDTFRTGHFVGRSLVDVFLRAPKSLNALVRKNCIYIQNFALSQLEEVYGEKYRIQFNLLIINRDSNFKFHNKLITSADTILKGYGGFLTSAYSYGACPALESSFYENHTIKQILEKNPLYIIALIKSLKIEVSSRLLKDFTGDEPFFDDLKSAVDYNVRTNDEAMENWQDELNQIMEEEDRKYYEKEAYYAAFEGNPENEWNID